MKLRDRGPNVVKIYLFLLIPLFIASCAPSTQKSADCGVSESFDPVTRTCISGVVVPDTPVPTTNSIVISEDSTNNLITLEYTVSNSSLASQCLINSISKEINNGSEIPPFCSCTGGVCTTYLNPIQNFSGNAGLTYSLTNNYGTSQPFVANVTVTPVNDPPVVITPASFSTEENKPLTQSLQSFVSDIDGDVNYSFVKVTNPSNGNVTLNSITGIFYYIPNVDYFGPDTFQWMVTDSGGLSSNIGTVHIVVNEVIKPPTGSSQTVSINEDTTTSITLGYFDRNGFPPLSCIVSDLINVSEMVLCSCSGGNCSVTVKPTSNYFTYYKGSPVAGANVNFKYEINNQAGSTGKYQVTLNVNEVNDPPLAVSQGVSGLESTSNYPLPINFTIKAPEDYDNHDNSPINDQVLTLSVSASPTQGTLSNCLLQTPTGQNLACTYTPIDGNANGTNYFQSELSNQNVKLVATFPGTFGANISYLLKGGTRLGVEYLEVNGNQIIINMASGQTKASKIVSLINGDLYASKLVAASVIGADLAQSSFATPLNLVNMGGKVNFDDFQLIANDGITNSVPGEDSINIEPTNDQPVVCEYSTFEEAYECGILGCIASGPPVGKIAPTKSNIYYFDSTAAICWRSTGIMTTSWEIINSHISDQFANEQEDIWIQSIRVDEGGGEYSEVFQQLRIVDLKSSNTLLLPTANITFYFNNAIIPLNTWFGSSTSSASQFDFAIKMVPQEGQYGETNVSFVLEDTSGATTTSSFKVKVFNSAANNNGWVNLAAVGPTTNHFGQKVSPILTCSYYLDKCSLPGQTSPLIYPCVGQVDPQGSIMGSVKKLIYYNEKDDTCWLNDSPTTATNTGWVKFNSYCNISQEEVATECSSNGSCIFSNKNLIEDLIPTAVNNFYYDSSAGTCYRSTGTQRGNVQSYTATGSVTLVWRPFSQSGEGHIEGYDVYRRLTTSATTPTGIKINRKPISAETTSYEDNGKNSIFAPVPSTVYYYEVKPIINNLPTGTLEKYSIVRITVPPDNMAFVHRWIANQRACEQLHSTQINSLDNFSCPYIAPGEVIPPLATTPPGIYDIGMDLLVDRFEAGCPYSLAPICTTGTRDNACIGLNDPNTAGVTAPLNSIYYNRSNGQCLINRGGANPWVLVSGIMGGDVITDHRVAQMAPLTNITQEETSKFCTRPNKGISGILGFKNPTVPIPSQLPNRLFQKAYSMWSPLLTDFEVLSLESGLSLNATPKCNTSLANGLENNYTETATPDSSSYYTLPGSKSSNIRSLISGSDQTSLCQSGFGVQDAVGNVSEWTLERISCPNFSQCNGILFGEANALISRSEDFFRTPSDDVDFRSWKLDGIRGPCNDSDADGICDGIISSWQISEQSYGAGRMAIPMALPIMVDFPTLFPYSPVNPYILNIGPTSGITAAQLHEDTWTFNNQNIYATSNACGSMNTGGNYNDSNGAGVYNFEFLPCLNDAYNYLIVGEIGIKSILNEQYSLELIQPLTASATLRYSFDDPNNNVTVNLATDGEGNVTTKYTDLNNCLNNPTICFCGAGTSCNRVFISNVFPGITSSNSSAVFPMAKTVLNYVYGTVSNADVSTGFRCVTPIDYDEYIE